MIVNLRVTRLSPIRFSFLFDPIINRSKRIRAIQRNKTNMSDKDAEIARLKEALETKKRLHTETNKDAEIARLKKELETKKLETVNRDKDAEIEKLRQQLETKKKNEELRTLEKSRESLSSKSSTKSKTTSGTSDLDDELSRLTLELEEKKKALREGTTHMATMKEEKAAKRAEVIKRVVAEVDTKMNGKTLMDFYSLTAGQNVISGTKTDKYGNADGRQFDLGKEGAFNNFTVLIGQLYDWGDLTEEVFMKDAGAALKSKGFKLKFVATESEFIKHLFQFDVAWIISAKQAPSSQFLAAVKKFHEMGRGIALWADNDPWHATVNAVLNDLGVDGQVQGNYYADKILNLGSSQGTGQFGKHLVTSGIQSLYEGVTICNCRATSWLKPLATATDGKYCVLYGDEKTGLDDGRGRVLVDCGFTKLFCNWDTAGTGRYVRNVCVWLLGLDHKFTVMATLNLK